MRYLLLLPFLGFSNAAYAELLLFSDMIQKPGLRETWRGMMAGRKFAKWDRWIPTFNGVQEPVQSVALGGAKFVRATACQPHNCQDNKVYVLANPVTKEIWLAHRELDAAGKASFSYFGNPDEATKAALRSYFGN